MITNCGNLCIFILGHGGWWCLHLLYVCSPPPSPAYRTIWVMSLFTHQCPTSCLPILISMNIWRQYHIFTNKLSIQVYDIEIMVSVWEVPEGIYKQSVKLHNAVTFKMLHYVVTFDEKWQNLQITGTKTFLTRYYENYGLKKNK